MSHAYRTVRHVMTLLALLLLVAASKGIAQWAAAPSIPQNRTAGMPVAVNGKLYLFGGSPELEISLFSIASGSSNTAWVLNQGGSSWSQLAAMPDARSGGYAAALNGKIYILGGSRIVSNQIQFATSVLEYDAVTNKYTAKSNMPVPLTSCAGAVVGSKIYLLGGATVVSGRLTISNVALMYDVLTDSWTQLDPIPYAAVWPSAVGINSDVYLVGGVTGNGTTRNVYKGAAGGGPITWTKVKDLPIPIGQEAVGVLGNKMYVSGGQNENGFSKKTYFYDAPTNAWTSSYALPNPTASNYGLINDGTSIYFVGGTNTKNVWKLSEGPAKPIATVTPLSQYVTVKTGQSQNVVISITNDGVAPLSGAFVIPPAAQTWLSTPNTSVNNVAGGATTTATFQVGSPSVVAGNYSTTVQFQSNDQAHNDIPITINLYVRDELVSQPTKVLIEEGTGTWCGWCPYAHDILHDIEESKGDQVIALSYHGPVGSGDPWTSTAIDQVLGALGLGGYPNASFQRWLLPGQSAQMIDRGSFATAVDQVLTAQPNAPVKLEVVEYAYNAGTKNVTAKLKLTGAVAIPLNNIDLKINAVVSQDSIVGDQTKYYSDGSPTDHFTDYLHRHVVRTLWPDNLGQTINVPAEALQDNVLLPSSDVTINVTFKATTDDADKSTAVFFVHLVSGNTLGPVLQATSVPLTASITGGGGTTSFAVNTPTMTKAISAGDSTSFTTTVQNTGTNPVTVTISRTVNSLPDAGWQSYFCEGSACTDPSENGMAPLTIAPGQTKTITVKVKSGAAGTAKVTLRYAGNNGTNTDQEYTVNASSEGGVDNAVAGNNGLLLAANVPNPASSFTTFNYAVPTSGVVTVEVYSMAGQKVMGLNAGRVESGSHSFELNVASLPAGVYSVRLVSNGHSVSRMITVAR